MKKAYILKSNQVTTHGLDTFYLLKIIPFDKLKSKSKLWNKQLKQSFEYDKIKQVATFQQILKMIFVINEQIGVNCEGDVVVAVHHIT